MSVDNKPADGIPPGYVDTSKIPAMVAALFPLLLILLVVAILFLLLKVLREFQAMTFQVDDDAEQAADVESPATWKLNQGGATVVDIPCDTKKTPEKTPKIIHSEEKKKY